MNRKNFHLGDTIVALSSPGGPGRRAVLRLSGSGAVAAVNQLFESANGPLSPLCRGLTHGSVRLPGLLGPLPTDVYVFPEPRSYTGQLVVELHTVSSPPIIERVISQLLAHDVRTAEPGEFTQRAFLAGKKDLTQAEAVLAVIEADSGMDLKAALAQLAGGLTSPLESFRSQLLDLLADLEAGLDFVEEDITFVGRSELLARLDQGLGVLIDVRRQLDDRTVSGRTVRVALVGRPNAGKSSLFNALCGRTTALVSDIAGTTRDYLVARLELNGVAIDLIDTAGTDKADSAIEVQAQSLAGEQRQSADLVVWCVPVDEPLPADDRLTGRVLTVRTKGDLASVVDAPGTLTTTVRESASVEALRGRIAEEAKAIHRPLAPSQSRCRHHVEAAIEGLQRAHQHVLHDDPQELVALELRHVLQELGEMVGAIYTNDLLDRIFSRFCLGK